MSDGQQLWMQAARILNSDEAEGRAAEAQRLSEQAVEAFRQHNDTVGLARALATASMACSYSGDLSVGISYGFEALELQQKAGLSVESVMLRDSLARDLRKVGRHQEAKEVLAQAHSQLDGMMGQTAARRMVSKPWWRFWG
jgi:tetratricopeptide (TPR) repeat protein